MRLCHDLNSVWEKGTHTNKPFSLRILQMRAVFAGLKKFFACS